MRGPLLRNHSSTVTRATRPVTLTCTALLIFSTRPVGRGWVGSIQPCPVTAPASVTSSAPAVAKVLKRETMTPTLCEMGRETLEGGNRAQGCVTALRGLILDGPERPGTAGRRALPGR